MPRFHTSFGRSAGKERLRAILLEALPVCRTRGVQVFENEIRNYCHENPQLRREMEQAIRILQRMPYQSKSRTEAEIDNL